MILKNICKMKILLDTHILLWHLSDNKKLDKTHSEQIENPKNSLFFSIASLWEIAIKTSIGKLEIKKSIEHILPKEILILNIRIPHIQTVKELPFHHRGPFDRMLISQAKVDDLIIMSDDKNFIQYDVKLL